MENINSLRLRQYCLPKINKIWNGGYFSENIPLSHIADDMDWPFLHHAQFTPKGHSLIMVYNYDIYYRLGPRTYQSYRVTDDAMPGIIYNGIPDWLYEGESIVDPENCYLFRLKISFFLLQQKKYSVHHQRFGCQQTVI